MGSIEQSPKDVNLNSLPEVNEKLYHFINDLNR